MYEFNRFNGSVACPCPAMATLPVMATFVFEDLQPTAEPRIEILRCTLDTRIRHVDAVMTQ